MANLPVQFHFSSIFFFDFCFVVVVPPNGKEEMGIEVAITKEKK